LDIKLRILKEEWKKKFAFSLLENEIEFIENENIWVTPSLPLIVFILFGYIFSILGRYFKNIFKNLF
jgi:hypothetical protein